MSATNDSIVDAARISPLRILPRSYFRNLFVQQDDALILLDHGDSREKAKSLWECLNTFAGPCDHIEECVITDSFYESKVLYESFDQITASFARSIEKRIQSRESARANYSLYLALFF
jgi:hypothetical protein